MNTTLLFSRSDVTVIRRIATSFDEDTFNTFALEAQRNYLPTLLGPSLYNDLLTNPTAANNVRLLDGDTYTNPQGYEVQYEGLKVYLAYLWLYTFAREGNFKYSEVGPSQYQDDNSQRAGNRSDQDTKKQLGKNANLQGRGTIDFLMTFRADFPLYTPIPAEASKVVSWRVRGRSVGKYANSRGYSERYYRDIEL